MWRYTRFFVLLLAGGGIMPAGLVRTGDDPLRGSAIVACCAIGLLMAFIGLNGRPLPIRPVVRGLAVLMALVVAGGTLALWYALHFDALPQVPKDHPLRASLGVTAGNLLWLAGALGYLAAAVAALPIVRPLRPDEERSKADSTGDSIPAGDSLADEGTRKS